MAMTAEARGEHEGKQSGGWSGTACCPTLLLALPACLCVPGSTCRTPHLRSLAAAPAACGSAPRGAPGSWGSLLKRESSCSRRARSRGRTPPRRVGLRAPAGDRGGGGGGGGARVLRGGGRRVAGGRRSVVHLPSLFPFGTLLIPPPPPPLSTCLVVIRVLAPLSGDGLQLGKIDCPLGCRQAEGMRGKWRAEVALQCTSPQGDTADTAHLMLLAHAP